MHPQCFDIFKHASIRRFGKVHIDGLRQLWLENDDYGQRFPEFPERPDVSLVNEQFYQCVPGTEYLVAHPVRIPGLLDLIQNCIDPKEAVAEVFSIPSETKDHGGDPFAVLSPELKLMIILEMHRQDLASLRLVSRSFRQLPQIYFHQLVLSEMPWMLMDLEELSSKQVDWYQLWCRLSAADGGSEDDEPERRWLEWAKEPNLFWDELYSNLSSNERERFGILPRVSGELKVTDEQYEKMEAVIEERRETRQQWPKATELKGLRNRRRIYGDVEKILQRIEKLDQTASEERKSTD